MLKDDISEALQGNVKATTFIVDNFSSVQYVGAGPYSVVFKANSRQFHAR